MTRSSYAYGLLGENQLYTIFFPSGENRDSGAKSPPDFTQPPVLVSGLVLLLTRSRSPRSPVSQFANVRKRPSGESDPESSTSPPAHTCRTRGARLPATAGSK